MIVSGLNENESQEREQGGIMWREIEFHLYRGHLLTLRFLGGNGAEHFSFSLSLENVFQFGFFFLCIMLFLLSVFHSKRVHILSSFYDIWVQHAL